MTAARRPGPKMKNRLFRFIAVPPSLLPVFGLFLMISTTGTACRSRALVEPPAPSISPGARDLSGFRIQVGVFSHEDNAIRLALSLRQRGLNAFYFFHETRLFKVQVGPYASRDEAIRAAKGLAVEGILDAYLIIPPGVEIIPGRTSGPEDSLRERLASTALGYLEYPYVWGGSSPEEGFDCSGLAMAVYQLNGLPLPRALAEQYEAGKRVPRNAMKKGDLVFFSMNKTSRVSHVGIIVGPDRFVHAPGRYRAIRPDSLSDPYFRDRILAIKSYL